MKQLKDLLLVAVLLAMLGAFLHVLFSPYAAYREGQRARRSGQRLEDNPYPPDRMWLGLRSKWAVGWQEGYN